MRYSQAAMIVYAMTLLARTWTEAQTAPAALAISGPWGPAPSPKTALKWAHLATFMPQTEPLSDVCYADDAASRAFLEAWSQRSAGGQRLAAAVRARFGKNALKPLLLEAPSVPEAEKELREGGDPALAAIDAAIEVPDGDHAILRYAGAPGGIAHAKLQAGWKINFVEIGGGIERHGLMPGYKEPDATLQWLRDQGRIDEALGRDVAAGKFATVDGLKAERQRRQDEAGKALDRFKLAGQDDNVLLARPATHPANVQPSTRPADVGEYYSKTLGVRVGRPRGWEVQDPLPKKIADEPDWIGIWEPDDAVPHGVGAASLNVMEYAAWGKNTTLEDVLEQRRPSTTQPVAGSRPAAPPIPVRIQRIQMAGCPGYLLLELGELPGDQNAAASDFVQAFTLHNGRIYVVQMTFAPNQWPRYEPMFHAVLARFAFEPK